MRSWAVTSNKDEINEPKDLILLAQAFAADENGGDGVPVGPDYRDAAMRMVEMGLLEFDRDAPCVLITDAGRDRVMKQRRLTNCRRCTECPDLSHHWMPDFDDGPWEHSPEPRPVWGCKHCDFTMVMTDPEEDPEEVYAKRVRDVLPNLMASIEGDYMQPDYPRDLLVKEITDLRERLAMYESRDEEDVELADYGEEGCPGCERLRRRVAGLRGAVGKAINLIDRGLGDTDPIVEDVDEDEFPIVVASQVLCRVHRPGGQPALLKTEHLGYPITQDVLRHNAYVAGWEHGATDFRADMPWWNQMRELDLIGPYTHGLESGQTARELAFKVAKEVRHG